MALEDQGFVSDVGGDDPDVERLIRLNDAWDLHLDLKLFRAVGWDSRENQHDDEERFDHLDYLGTGLTISS
jgi:hypothetical protein